MSLKMFRHKRGFPLGNQPPLKFSQLREPLTEPDASDDESDLLRNQENEKSPDEVDKVLTDKLSLASLEPTTHSYQNQEEPPRTHGYLLRRRPQ